MEFRKALGELRAIWVAGNEYLTRAAPWTTIKTDRDRAAASVRMGLNLVHLFGHLSWPVIPERRPDHPQCGDGSARDHSLAGRADGRVPRMVSSRAQPIQAPPVLFAKITDEQIAEWEARFGGDGTASPVASRFQPDEPSASSGRKRAL